jgi:hypothetical protein
MIRMQPSRIARAATIYGTLFASLPFMAHGEIT